MDSQSDQLQAEIAQTRARIADGLDRLGGTAPRTLGTITSVVTEQVRKRPISSLVIALLADSLLQNIRGGSKASPADINGKRKDGGMRSVVAQASGGVGAAVDRVGVAAQEVGNVASDAAGTVSDIASSAAQRVTSSAKSVVEAGEAATAVVAETVSDTVQRTTARVAHTADDVTETIKSLPETLTDQVYQRPLAAVGLAIGAGALLQPTFAPYVHRVTTNVRQTAGSLSANVAPAFVLPNQDEVGRLAAALVPATLTRARNFTNRDLREYLDARLADTIPQAPVRAGLIAAVTERVDQVVDARLPGMLERNLSGTRALLAMALLGALLHTRNRNGTADGKAASGLLAELVELLTRTSQEQLEQYFPEFKEQLAAGAHTNGPIAM
jgi:hypothetical protein